MIYIIGRVFIIKKKFILLLCAFLMLISAFTLTACNNAPQEVIISFVAYGEDAFKPITRNIGYTYGELPMPYPMPIRLNYGLSWWTAREGGERVVSETIVSLTTNHTLYARWTFLGTISQNQFLDSNRNRWALGRNNVGQLGNGTTDNEVRYFPELIEKETQFSQISFGSSSLALDGYGNLFSWGNELVGQNTWQARPAPIQIMPDKQFISAAGGSFGIDMDGRFWSWGDNSRGRLGLAGIYRYSEFQGRYIYWPDGRRYLLSPIQIMQDNTFVQVAAGTSHTLALDTNGRIWSWGLGTEGQLGVPIIMRHAYTVSNTTPQQVISPLRFSRIFANRSNSFAIDTNGGLWGWGDNGVFNLNGALLAGGWLGDGTTTTRARPVRIAQGTRFLHVSTSGRNTVAIDIHGRLWSWGVNVNGQVGDGYTTVRIGAITSLNNDRLAPVHIIQDTLFSYACASGMAIDIHGNFWGWGSIFSEINNSDFPKQFTLGEI